MDAKPIGNSGLNLQASAADPPLGSGMLYRSAYNTKMLRQVVVLQFAIQAKNWAIVTLIPSSTNTTLEVPGQSGDDFQRQR